MEHPELKAEVQRRRTFAIISHPDAGKTTLTEKLLGDKTALLDGGPGTARQTRRRLEAEGLLGDGEGELLIENSAGSEAMIARCRELLLD